MPPLPWLTADVLPFGMAGNLSPRAQQKLASLQALTDKVQHVYGLVERYAASRTDQQAEVQVMPLRRAFSRLKVELMGAGFDSMAQLAGSMETAARRGGSVRNKARILREGVGSLRFQMELEQRKVVSEDEEARDVVAEDQEARD